MNEEQLLHDAKKEWGGTLQAYLTGFFTCFVLTSFSFTLVATKVLSHTATLSIICTLAFVQAFVQLTCFLHLKHEAEPRWKRHFFYLMLFFLFIVAFGTLWIMYDLNVRTMDMFK